MSTRKLTNVTLKDYRDFLTKAGCKKTRIEGGHEIWSRKDLTRPIVVQTHESPVPEFIVKTALRNLKLTKKDFFNILFSVSEKENPKEENETEEPILDGDECCYCGSGLPYRYCHGKRKNKQHYAPSGKI